MPLNPDSSLGGARPKASVLDNQKRLWIAKFPAKVDNKDAGGWEMVVHDLAKSAERIVNKIFEMFIEGRLEKNWPNKLKMIPLKKLL